MSNNWQDYPRTRPAARKPLIDTGEREGYEEIRDGAKVIGSAVKSAGGWLLRKLLRRAVSQPTTCVRAAGHDGPCNGFPREDCNR